MTDDRRMTTDRFYGGVSTRVENLRSMLEYIETVHPSREQLNEWVIANTSAGSQDAVRHHLTFLDSVEIIDLSENKCELSDYGEQWLRDQNPESLYAALSSGVKGFDTILEALDDGPMTDEDIMDLLVSEFDEAEMSQPGPAVRHREWLQALGFVEREDGINRLTSKGREVLDSPDSEGQTGSMRTPPKGVSVGDYLSQEEIEQAFDTGFGYQISGINPRRDAHDNRYVLLFANEDGPYGDSVTQGTFEYIGEGLEGDQSESSPGNAVLIDAIESDIPIYFFYQAVGTSGQWTYQGSVDALEYDRETRDGREVLVFTMSHREGSDATEPTVYQVPISTDNGGIRANFERTIRDGVPSDTVREIFNLSNATETVRVWGNQADEAAEPGDYLLFADRDGRRDGEYTVLARIAEATVLDDATARSITNAVGWGEQTDAVFPHVMLLEPVYEADVDRATLWELLGFKGWPNDTYSAINFDRDGSTFFEQYDSVNEFLADAPGQELGDDDEPPQKEGWHGPTNEHPLIDAAIADDRTTYKITAPPEYWRTVYGNAAIGLEEDDKTAWHGVQPGDVLLFHSTGEPSPDELPTQPSGLIGGAIAGERTTKPADADWWYDERPGRPKADSFPYLLTFDRLFATGELERIDFDQPTHTVDTETLADDVATITSNRLAFETVEAICAKVSDQGFPRHRTITELPDDRGPALADALAAHLTEVSPVALHRSFDGSLPTEAVLEDLHFPDDGGDEIVAQLQGALRAGKHVILTGPPGTGKTEIARQAARTLATDYPSLYSGSQVTTATADWSTFDTVGGYMPSEDVSDAERLSFTPGLVLNRLKAPRTNTQRNEPLVIDELNRADIDKAFGQLFTVLSGQSVTLPYTAGGEEISISPATSLSSLPPHAYRVPEAWRLIGTLNTYDKTSLYEMSYAFMRRFSFIRVPAPNLEGLDPSDLADLIEDYAAEWDLPAANFDSVPTQDQYADVGLVWQATNTAIDGRAVGPAIVRDILAQLGATDGGEWSRALTQAVISYIFPQLEGVPKRSDILQALAGVDAIDADLLDTAARDMLSTAVVQESDG